MSDVMQLLSFNLVKLNITVEPAGVPFDVAHLNMEANYDVFVNNENPSDYILLLRIGGTGPPLPDGKPLLTLDIHGTGQFRTPPGLDPAQREALVKINGGMILYGMMRGQLAMVTGAFPFSSILLPTVDWQEFVKIIEANRAAVFAQQQANPATAVPLQDNSPSALSVGVGPSKPVGRKSAPKARQQRAKK